MKTHLPSRLRSALLTALASVSIPTLTAASLVTFSSQAAAEYKPAFKPDGTAFTKGWTNENPEEYYITSTNSALLTIGKSNVKVTGAATGNSKGRNVGFIGASDTDKIYYAEVAYTDTTGTTKTPTFSGAIGTAVSQTITGSMYLRYTGGGNVSEIHAAKSVTLTGDTYLEIAGDATANYDKIFGAYDATINGSSTIVVKSGNIKALYGCGTTAGGGVKSTIKGSSYVEIDGGTFRDTVSAGCQNGNGGTIDNGTYLLINRGTFNAKVYAGSTSDTSTITGGTHTCITGGEFYNRVSGSGNTAGAEINGGIDLTITGGTFSGSYGIYAAYYGKVNDGQVSLTIRGDKASFTDKYIISAGPMSRSDVTFGADVTGKVTLAELTAASSLLNPASSGIQVRGISTKDTVLEMSKVNGTLNAKLSYFTSMEVKDGSTVTLTQALNGSLGGATKVNIAEGSTLALESAEGQTWTLSTTTLDGAGTLGKTGKGTLAVSGTTSAFTGSMNIAEGTMEVQNGMKTASLGGSGKLAKRGAGTMSVENASGFTGDIEATGGKLELEKVGLTGGKVRNVSVSTGATVNLLDMKNGTDSVLAKLDINGGEFGVYKSDVADTGTNDSNVGTLTLAEGDKIVVGTAGGKLEANLTTKAGSTLDFRSGAELTMGCDLNVGKGTWIAISNDDYASLMDGNDITLFTGVDNKFSMDVTDYVICDLATASEGSGEQKAKVYFQTVEGNAVLSTTEVPTPEPTTGTLSLLALAGLCARRRRKH